MLRNLAGCVIAAALATTADAQDHLEPEDSIYTSWYDHEFDQYESIVVSKFKDSFDHGYIARAIVIPSFEPEWAVAIQQQEETFSFLYLKPEMHLWLFEVLKDYETGRITSRDREGNDTTQKDIRELRDQLTVPLDKVKVERCELPVDAPTGMQLSMLWRTALRQTRFPDKRRIGFDGVTYHFSGNFDQGAMAGKIWRPDKGSSMGKLILIIDQLRAACVAKDASILEDVHLRAVALCAEIGCTD